ncbi:putative ABC transporter (fragment) [Nostocoides australiense Ben110]|uniref:Putative ABC transporter n=1 Tax=Nostocoides australiense Ben110 TaxID=1193182 RepID=W6JXG2_9MICO
MATPLRSNRPIWWSLLSILQILLAIAVVVGLVWTLVEVFFGAQNLVDLPMWHVGPFGLPLVLLVGGLLLGWLLALLSRWFAGIGARRRAAGTGKRLDVAIGEVADRVIVAPVSDVLARHRQTRIQLETAAAGGKR